MQGCFFIYRSSLNRRESVHVFIFRLIRVDRIHTISLHADFLTCSFFQLNNSPSAASAAIVIADELCVLISVHYILDSLKAFYVREQFAFSCVCSNCCSEFVLRTDLSPLHARLSEGILCAQVTPPVGERTN